MSSKKKTMGEINLSTEMKASTSGLDNFFYLEDLLQSMVSEVNSKFKADGCSIFLWDDDAEKYVLRESTVMTPFLGRYALDHTKDISRMKCGITTRTAITGKIYLSTNVHQDPNWSWHNATESNPQQDIKTEPCELSTKDLGSMIAVPFKDERDFVFGVLRIVRKISKKPFDENDKNEIADLITLYSRELFGIRSLGQLLDLGSTLDLTELCDKSVQLLTTMAGGKGCSIFLLDEEASSENNLIYKCKATTGLEIADSHNKYKELSDHTQATYEIPKDFHEGFITAYVLETKRNIVLENIHSPALRRELGITRHKKHGKFSERYYKSEKRSGTGPSMATPLLFREQFDKNWPAMGVIRLTRPTGDKTFSEGEQRRFLSLANKLSKTILQHRYIRLLNDLSTGEDEHSRLQRIADEVPKLIGGKGCSVFMGGPLLELKATSGRLERNLKDRTFQPYNLEDEKERGLTGAAAVLKESLKFNDETERRKLEAAKGIRHSGRKECEIDESPPSRFLAVPILTEERAVGVIRIPKTKTESPFSKNDVRMLESIADRLGQISLLQSQNNLSKWFPSRNISTISEQPKLLEMKSMILTICFWDIRGFSKLCDDLRADPELIAGFIKDYYSSAAKQVFEHDGVLDKFIGDGIMALFGFLGEKTAEGEDTAALSAARTAAALTTEFSNILQKWEEKWQRYIPQHVTIGLGCGIHTGEVLAGILETKIRDDFTALGYGVNLASRICAKAESGEILVSQTTRARLAGHFTFRIAGRIEDIKNIPGAFDLYAIQNSDS